MYIYIYIYIYKKVYIYLYRYNINSPEYLPARHAAFRGELVAVVEKTLVDQPVCVCVCVCACVCVCVCRERHWWISLCDKGFR